jgi:cytochrome c2
MIETYSGSWKMGKSIIGIIGAVAIAMILLCVGAFSLDAVVDHGKEVYATQKCGLCHSISGIGGKKLALDGIGSKLNHDEMKKWIRTPRDMKTGTTMKAYPNLPEKDLEDLIAYLMTLR